MFSLLEFCFFVLLIIRKKKIVPGSLMKAMMRPGGGTAKPVDGDQVPSLILLC